MLTAKTRISKDIAKLLMMQLGIVTSKITLPKGTVLSLEAPLALVVTGCLFHNQSRYSEV